MALVKYWDGAVWQRLLSVGGGGTPSRVFPPARDQTGSVYEANTQNHVNVNAGAPGIYNTSTVVAGQRYQHATQLQIINNLWAGYGGTDVGLHGEVLADRSGAQIAVAVNIHAHAAYWVPIFLVAALNTAAGGEYNGFTTRLHFFSGSNVHSSGGVNWLQVAI